MLFTNFNYNFHLLSDAGEGKRIQYTMILGYVHCRTVGNNGEEIAKSDKEGVIVLKPQSIDR